MQIELGTTSDSKYQILLNALDKIKITKYVINKYEVSSGIDDQPFGEEYTLQGAINRAESALEKSSNADDSIGLGLEGGLVKISNSNILYLVCTAAIYKNPTELYFGISAKYPLPYSVSININKGNQFGDEIRKYREANEKDKLIFPHLDSLITREKAFTEALEIAFQTYNNKRHYLKN